MAELNFTPQNFSTGAAVSYTQGTASADNNTLHQLTAIFAPSITALGVSSKASMTAFAENTNDMAKGLAATTDSSALVNGYSSCIGICGKFDKAAKELIQGLGA